MAQFWGWSKGSEGFGCIFLCKKKTKQILGLAVLFSLAFVHFVKMLKSWEIQQPL